MKTYSRIVIRFAWIAACTGRIDSAKAEGAWTFVDKAASITKTLWDLGSSVVSKFSDYPVYSTAFVLENYIDLTETYDHGSKTMVRRSNWRDPVDQSSKYKTVTTTPIQSGLIISTLGLLMSLCG